MSVGVGLELRDKVPTPCHTLFVGINPAIRSAQVGHYYAHPTNMFWRLVSDSGISGQQVTAVQDDLLVSQGFGFTDVAKRPTPGASDLATRDFSGANARLAFIITKAHVKTVVMVSKTSARVFLGKASADIQYGRQATPFHGATVWFLPSTSGQSLGDTSYAEKLMEFRALANHIAGYRPGEVSRSKWAALRNLFQFGRPTAEQVAA